MEQDLDRLLALYQVGDVDDRLLDRIMEQVERIKNRPQESVWRDRARVALVASFAVLGFFSGAIVESRGTTQTTAAVVATSETASTDIALEDVQATILGGSALAELRF